MVANKIDLGEMDMETIDSDVAWGVVSGPSQDALRAAYHVLNVLAWEESNTNHFVPYDCLEDLVPYLSQGVGVSAKTGVMVDEVFMALARVALAAHLQKQK